MCCLFSASNGKISKWPTSAGRGVAEKAERDADDRRDTSEDAQDRVFLGLVANLPEVEHSSVGFRNRKSHIAGPDLLPVGHDHGPLDHVFQLANVAGP